MSVPLYAALAVPSFTIQAHIHQHPEWCRRAFALVHNSEGSSHQRSIVVDLSPAAMRQGLSPGANQWRARRRYPHVEFHPIEDGVAPRLWGEISMIASEESPRTLILKQGLLIIDLTGMQQLFRGGERGWASEFQKKLSAYESLSYSLILSSQMGSALLIARYRGHLGARFYPDKVGFAMGTSEELDPIPLHLVLGLSQSTQNQLKNYQIRTIAQLKPLNLSFLREHFGVEGELLWLVSQGRSYGKSPRSVTLESSGKKEGGSYQKKSMVDVQRQFKQDVQEHEVLKTHLHDVIDELAFEMRLQQRYSKNIVVELRYSDQKTQRESIILPRPTYKFVEIMEMVKPRFAMIFRRRVAIRSLRVIAQRCVDSGGQEDLFDQASSMIAIQEALDLIRIKHGFEKIGNPK